MIPLLAAFVLAQAAPVKLRIEAGEKVFRPGKPMPLRFTIENAGAAEAKVDEPDSYVEGLELKDEEGRVLKPLGRTKGIAKRSVSLEPGGFLGRVVDVSGAVAVPEDREGWVRFRWSFGDAESAEIRVLVIRDWLAKLETNHGEIHLEFAAELAPNHVLNFLALARSGFYDGAKFHRIIPGFMMQGGGVQPGKAPPKPLKAEFSETPHVFGTLSAARTADPNSATCEFFICFGAVPHLDGKYSVFGRLVEGADTVKAVERTPSDHVSPCKTCGAAVPANAIAPNCCGRHHVDRPVNDVVLKKVTLVDRAKK
jgi:cyclophilin family peptidyl-prolyl cis-trans isomerase